MIMRERARATHETRGMADREKGHRRAPASPEGSGVLVRRTSPDDSGNLRRMFARCSRETVYLRFHLPLPTVPEWAIRLLVGDLRRDGRTVVAVDGGEIVGHAMYVRDERGGREAEVAVVVEDGRRSGGVGRALLSEITREARLAGVELFTCTTLGDNYRLLSIARRAFPGGRTSYADGACSIRVPLTDGGVAR